jgi:hypothetical protein
VSDEERLSPAMLKRQRLQWVVATRQQLDRWEPLVALFSYYVRRRSSGKPLDDAEDAAYGRTVWACDIERHFALVAAHHLVTALRAPPPLGVHVDKALSDELEDGRHLHEHWDEQMPRFVRWGRNRELLVEPVKSGKRFAARNPKKGPYGSWSWNNKQGPLLLPNVPSAVVRELLDAVEAEVLASDPDMARFVPPRVESAWGHEDGEWWPKQPVAPPGSSSNVAE